MSWLFTLLNWINPFYWIDQFYEWLTHREPEPQPEPDPEPEEEEEDEDENLE